LRTPESLVARDNPSLWWRQPIEGETMVAVLSGVIGLVIGGIVAWSLCVRRTTTQRDTLSKAQSDLAVSVSELAAARDMLEKTREDHDAALQNMEGVFENLSNRVLAQTVQQFNQSQEQVQKERETTLDRTLKPLADLLDEYKRNLADFDKQHVGVLGEVKSRAEELLNEQRRSQVETRRLNQLLGRSDRRGRWGEIQLANVLEASGLHENIDYVLQVSSTSESGRSLRPDCVVNMPNGSRVAIDAKFPFDAFEQALDTEDADVRKSFEAKHAKDLRAHVKALREKAYWESISPAPEFVACFVPSDVAVSVAFDADPELLTYAARERVLIVGPTNLLSLLWSVVMVVRQQKLAINAEEIYKVAETIFDRIRLVAEPVSRMGKALDTQVKEYNSMITSFETRLIVSARSLQNLGGAARAKELPELGQVERLSARLDEMKWGVDGSMPLAEGASEILDLEGTEEA
jgi:DNA recombination protein RmuC